MNRDCLIECDVIILWNIVQEMNMILIDKDVIRDIIVELKRLLNNI